jgi:hypothetical protein
VVVRARLGFDAQVKQYGALSGKVATSTLEWHVIGCRKTTGDDCAPADVAALEAARPALTMDQGMMRWSFQGAYVTCPTFEADPEGTLAGTNDNPPDAGTPPPGDGGAGDLGIVVGPVNFSTGVQADLDAMGCATGACHNVRTAPGQMHLVFKPMGADVRANFDAALPWTKGPPVGGRLVNEVNLPAAMRARWLRWIADGTPF